MTTGVNTLSDRATGRRTASANPQVLSGFRPFIDAFEALGCDRAGVLRAAGLTERDFGDPDAVVTDAACAAFFQEALRQRPIANFGLRVAEQIPIGAYPLLDYLVLTSESVGEGFRRLAKYLRLVGSRADLTLFEEGDPIAVRLAPCNPFNTEFTLSLSVLHFRRETNGGFGASRLCLRHRPEDPEDFEQRLGCPLRTACDTDELAVSRAVWRLPLRRRDSLLHGVLRTQADGMLARLGTDDRAVAQVRRALAGRLPGDTTLAAVARLLGTSPRSLQRRLGEEGTSYQEVLDDVRRETAESYLRGSGLSCAEVGYLLGFSEPAAFTRAFKRWRGVTPLDWRRGR
jgi:AraC-like DNA-binding protein